MYQNMPSAMFVLFANCPTVVFLAGLELTV